MEEQTKLRSRKMSIKPIATSRTSEPNTNPPVRDYCYRFISIHPNSKANGKNLPTPLDLVYEK
jgi:hypothetical protein